MVDRAEEDEEEDIYRFTTSTYWAQSRNELNTISVSAQTAFGLACQTLVQWPVLVLRSYRSVAVNTFPNAAVCLSTPWLPNNKCISELSDVDYLWASNGFESAFDEEALLLAAFVVFET